MHISDAPCCRDTLYEVDRGKKVYMVLFLSTLVLVVLISVEHEYYCESKFHVLNKNENTLKLAVRSNILSNSSLQAVCDTPIARIITGCVSSLRI